LTSKLLAKNPEYYTIWNHRRVILLEGFFPKDEERDDTSEEQKEKHEISYNLIKDDIRFLFPLQRKYPKCYWIWDYRLWLLDQANKRLPPDVAKEFWEQELALVSQMLVYDNRNFHGWGYRRMVIANLERPELSPGKSGTVTSLTKPEVDYSLRMIKINLSNFSAWHNRLTLIPLLLTEQSASHAERLAALDEEFKLITNGLYTSPEDQSLWFYHQGLVETNLSAQSHPKCLAPEITKEEKLSRLDREVEMIHDLLDLSDDCKWLYEALFTYELIRCEVKGDGISPSSAKDLETWLCQLKDIDPMRTGRWNDELERVASKTTIKA
jgi:geranylgeranyl transferase type-2 subunit alpha